MAYDATPEKKDDAAMQKRGEKAKKMAEAAFKKQAIYAPLRQAQAEIFYPERADFTMTYTDAAERYDGLATSEPSMMRQSMAQRLGAMMRPRGKHWFKVQAFPEHIMEDDDAKRWCEDATTTMRNVVYSPSANFTKAMAESDHDYVTFGNAVIAHPYNTDQSGLIFSCLHLNDCAWSKNAEGKVDVMHNRMRLTLRQIVQLFGKDALPREWQREWDQGHQEVKKQLYRSVCPIEDGDYEPAERIMRDAKFSACYTAIDVDGDPTMACRQFKSFPFTVREWMSVSQDDYARSPCTSVALADGRTLNSAEADLLTGIELKVRAPLVARKSALDGPLALQAGSVTFVNDYDEGKQGSPVRPIDIGEPRYGMEYVERTSERIARAFFENLLTLPEGEMTAYEVSERIEMYVRDAAPVFEPMEAENAMLMDSVFVRAMDKGAFGQVYPDGSIEGLPEALSGADIRFEFETPLSEALQKLKASQFDQLIGRASALIASQHPGAIEALDNIDFDTAWRDAMDGMAPAKWQKKKDDVEALRVQRAQQAAEAQAQEEAMRVAETAAKANPENIRMASRAMRGEEIA
jgi:hypothetical protein